MKTDTLFYHLFQKWPKLFLSMLGFPEHADCYEYLSEEVKQTRFQIDGIFKPNDTQQGLPLIFIEVQFQTDLDFYSRFYSEIMLYLHRHKPGRPWLALVIYPSRKTERPPSIEYAFLVNSLHTKRIYLEDFLKNPKPDNILFRLIVCSESETDDLVQTLINADEQLDQDIVELVETILIYKFPSLSLKEIKAMFSNYHIELKQTRFYQEMVEEERQEAMEIGKQETASKLFLVLLEAKFGKLDQALQTKIHEASPEQIENWMKKIFLADSAESLVSG